MHANRLGRLGSFWAAAAVLVLCLGSSAAPSVLYPVYTDVWNLNEVVIASVFGLYPIGLLIALLTFGGISDVLGRRRVVLVGLAMLALATIVLAVAPNTAWLYAGRLFQGLATGISLGAATASLVENNPSTREQLPGSIAVASTGVGLAIGTVLPGLLVEYAPYPLTLTYVFFLALTVLVFAATWLSPETRRPHEERTDSRRTRLRGRTPTLPRGLGLAFAAGTLCVSAGYAMGAVFLALGAQMARELTHTDNSLVIGGLLAASSAATAIAAFFGRRIAALPSILAGGTLLLAGAACMVTMAILGSVAWFIAWCVIGGSGFALLLSGGLGLLNISAPPDRRGAATSLLYSFAYAGQALFAIAAGTIATLFGLERAVVVVAPIVGAAILGAMILSVVNTRRRHAR